MPRRLSTVLPPSIDAVPVLQSQLHGDVLRYATLHDGAKCVFIQTDEVAIYDRFRH